MRMGPTGLILNIWTTAFCWLVNGGKTREWAGARSHKDSSHNLQATRLPLKHLKMQHASDKVLVRLSKRYLSHSLCSFTKWTIRRSCQLSSRNYFHSFYLCNTMKIKDWQIEGVILQLTPLSQLWPAKSMKPKKFDLLYMTQHCPANRASTLGDKMIESCSSSRL